LSESATVQNHLKPLANQGVFYCLESGTVRGDLAQSNMFGVTYLGNEIPWRPP
jgi:hypothetical protein